MALLNLLYYLPQQFTQILAVVLGTLSALSDGMQFGWTSPISSILLSPTSPISTTKGNIIFLETVYMIGGISGIPFTICLVNRIGRKNTILLAAAENLVAWIVIATSSSIVSLSTARFIAGFAAVVNMITAPMYVSEVSDKNIRGRLASIIYIMVSIGILIIYSAGPYLSITNSALIGASIVAFQLFTFFFMSESPYFYLIKNRKEDARRSLQILRLRRDVEEELNNIEETIMREKAEQGNILDLFRIKSNLKAMIIATVLVSARHYAGTSVMYMNLHMILIEAGSSLTENVAAIILAVIALIASLSAGSLIDKIGRKILLYTSSFVTGMCLFLLAFYFTVKTNGTDTTSFNWLPIVVVMLYGFTFECGLGLVPIVLVAEIFPTCLKAYGVAYSNVVFFLASLSSLYVFYALQTNFGIEAGFYLFGGCSIFTGLFTFFFVSETKRKSLDEIQSLLKGEGDSQYDTQPCIRNYGTKK